MISTSMFVPVSLFALYHKSMLPFLTPPPLPSLCLSVFLSVCNAVFLPVSLHSITIQPLPWVGVKNFGFTEKQKNIEQGSTKLKELHVCIMRVQKMVAWWSEVL